MVTSNKLIMVKFYFAINPLLNLPPILLQEQIKGLERAHQATLLYSVQLLFY